MTPLETAARAAYEAYSAVQVEAFNRDFGQVCAITWEERGTAYQQNWIAAFRAGLLALKRPSEAVLQAARPIILKDRGGGSSRTKSGVAFDIWSAMIDEVVKE